jgi:pyruvate kinase
LEFTDLPGRRRKIVVSEVRPEGVLGYSEESVYLESSLPFRVVRAGKPIASGRFGSVPPRETIVRLFEGDRLIVTREDEVGHPARIGRDGKVTSPAQIPCTLPEVFGEIENGQPILFDDGKFAGSVLAVSSERLEVRIDRAPPGGGRLRSDKGINLPETRLSLPALSAEDLQNLDFAVHHVDLLGLSFVREPADLFQLQDELKKRTKRQLGIALKIENRRAFENLPQLLLAGLREPPFAVMVARGDLGVEIGFERLAEVQEQILWLCEAAHVPVIWATQVLEGLAKKGVPSRAEVTDAAMSGRAECVMLNKGPFALRTVEFLDNVLLLMRNHHHKKTPMLRKLKVSEGRFKS